MDTKKSLKPWWMESFEIAVQDIRHHAYDLSELTKTKRERELTNLLAAHLLATDKEIIAVNEVNHSAISVIPSPLRDGERADLMIVERNQNIIKWEHPKLYAEFKFWYNYDLEPKARGNTGEFQAPRNYLDNLADLQRLYEFKKFSPETTCLQGFFFCYNIHAEGQYEVQGTGIAWFPEFLKTYCNPEYRTKLNQEIRVRTEKSTDEKIMQRRYLLDDFPIKKLSGAYNIIPIATKEETGSDFWLFLALVEVNL